LLRFCFVVGILRLKNKTRAAKVTRTAHGYNNNSKADCSDCPSLVVRVETCARAPYEETNCRWHTAAHRASGAVPKNFRELVITKAYDKRREERNDAIHACHRRQTAVRAVRQTGKAVTHLPYQLLQDRQNGFSFLKFKFDGGMNEISFRFIALTWPHRP
jgi:hypothetical protein